MYISLGYNKSNNTLLFILILAALLLLSNTKLVHAYDNPFQDGNIISLQADTGKWFSRCAGCQKTVDRKRFRDTITLHVDNPDAGHAKFTVVDMRNGKIALLSHTGKYVARCQGCIRGAAYPNAATVHADTPNGAWAQFTPVVLANGKYALRTDTGGYLTRCNNCSSGAAYPNTVTMHVRNPDAAYAQWHVHVWNQAPSAATVVNGYSVSSVEHANRGRFTKTGASSWTEYGNNGRAIFTFKERNRDEWSVYLFDQSRNVNIQLDLHRKKVRYGTNNGRMSDLYDITYVQ